MLKKYIGKVVVVDGVPYGIADRVSPSVKLYSQDTGRWSQTGPPLAQLPSKMRKLVDVDPGYKQIGYDLSNAELRVVAILSQDKMFIDAFDKGWDLHTLSACEFFGMDYPVNRTKAGIAADIEWCQQYNWLGDEDPRRKIAKVVVFRALYGGRPETAFSIPGANKLGLDRNQLTAACYRWLSMHPALDAFWAKHGEDAVKRFVVRNAYGRRRVLVDTDEKARMRQGINHPVQSFVSDLINLIVIETFCQCNETSIDASGRFKRKPLDNARLSGQMHDSVLWSMKIEQFEKLSEIALRVATSPRVIGGQTFQFPVSSYTKG